MERLAEGQHTGRPWLHSDRCSVRCPSSYLRSSASPVACFYCCRFVAWLAGTRGTWLSATLQAAAERQRIVVLLLHCPAIFIPCIAQPSRRWSGEGREERAPSWSSPKPLHYPAKHSSQLLVAARRFAHVKVRQVGNALLVVAPLFCHLDL